MTVPAKPPRNRPGQSALSYRIGTHPTFLRRMLERLSRHEVPAGGQGSERPLAKLATREPSDPAIALLDAWATAADVLTFYQERIADEGYLRTAGERRSVLELARTVGYELTPGVAASAWLAFDVDDPPGVAAVPAGTQVMSIPGQDQRPQTFETSRKFVAHAAWNRLAPAPPEPRAPSIKKDEDIVLSGTASGLRPGDVLLLKGDGDTVSRLVTVLSAAPDHQRGVTRVAWDGDVAGLPESPRVYAFRRRASLFGHDAPDWRSFPKEAETIINGTTVKHPVSREGFLREGEKLGDFPDEWPRFHLRAGYVDLDAVYPGILPGSWIVLRDESSEAAAIGLLKAETIRTASRDDFGLRRKVTQIDCDQDLTSFGLRDTVVFAESEELELALEAESSRISGPAVDLARVEPEPVPDQALIFAAGEATPGRGQTASFAALRPQVAFVEKVVDVPDHPEQMRVVLRGDLEPDYDPRTVVIYGNVAAATHGETVHEVLGGGDGARPHQRFVLRVPPLTHVATAAGVESTLEVRVDDVLWHQQPSFFGLDGQSHSYTVRIADDGVPTLLFGDGVHGARLPTGQENVTATYRRGSGPEGNVSGGSLALLRTRPLGVRAVINPLPAGGGAPPDDLEQARLRTPLSVRTLDRLVSLRDYETFARAYPGIGKARATALPAAGGRLLHLTAAGLGGAAVEKGSVLELSLKAALKTAGDAAQPVHIDSYLPGYFRLEAKVRIEPDYLPDAVVDRVCEALAAAFSFDARDFGQGVAASEVVAVIQGVEGVLAVDLDLLHKVDAAESLKSFLEARLPSLEPEPAELLLLRLDLSTLEAV